MNKTIPLWFPGQEKDDEIKGEGNSLKGSMYLGFLSSGGAAAGTISVMPGLASLAGEGIGYLGLGKGIGYVGLGYNKLVYRVFGSNFYSLHPRITTIGSRGIGFGQFDIYHRSTSFLRNDILQSGKYGVRNWNTVYSNYTLGGKVYSIGINPWKRIIFHEGPSLMSPKAK